MVSSVPTREVSPLVVIAGGGTGGHLFPALSVAESLRERGGEIRFVVFGTRRPIDSQILASTGCSLVQQPLVALHRAPWRWPGILSGYRQSCRMCRSHFSEDRPAIVLGTGGLGSVPAVREAVRLGIPTALLNPDARPGRANRLLAGGVDIVFVQWPISKRFLPRARRVEVLGCPVRSRIAAAKREDGILRFGLDARRKTLLVTGASQGARSINRAVLANLDYLEGQADWQVLHLTGAADLEEVRRAYASRSMRATVVAFTEFMGEAMAAADVVLARAGASSLAEITAVGRASILMPYPHHRDQHQLANARCLSESEHGAGAWVVEDHVDPQRNGPALRRVLDALMGDDTRRAEMAEACGRLGRCDAAHTIADRLVELAGLSPGLRRDDSLKAIWAETR